MEPTMWLFLVFVAAFIGYFLGKVSQHKEGKPYMVLLQGAGYILAGESDCMETMDLFEDWVYDYQQVRSHGRKLSGFDDGFALGLALLKDRLERTVKRRALSEIKNQRDALRHEKLTYQEVSERLGTLSGYLTKARIDWAQVCPDPDWRNFVQACYARVKQPTSELENAPSA